jgi:hypothetical protein
LISQTRLVALSAVRGERRRPANLARDKDDTMAKHSFSANFTGSAEDTTAKAKAAIEKAGGKFNGDHKKGDFSLPTPAGTVKGTYTITGPSFAVEITDKPFVVPGSAIESQVRKFLSQG